MNMLALIIAGSVVLIGIAVMLIVRAAKRNRKPKLERMLFGEEDRLFGEVAEA